MTCSNETRINKLKMSAGAKIRLQRGNQYYMVHISQLSVNNLKRLFQVRTPPLNRLLRGAGT